MQNNNRPDVGFIWKITDDVLRDTFKKNELGDVLLPFIVIRRLDCILRPLQENIRKSYLNFRDKVDSNKLDPILRKAAGGLQFYNTSQHNLESLKEDPRNIQINFKNYILNFNETVTDILENFQFDKVIARLIKNKLLYQLIEAIGQIDLSRETIDNMDMGYIFEELIRISNEQSNETAGEHFTPRDVISLMSNIIFSTENDKICKKGIIRTIYDPACGTGGMLSIAKHHIKDNICKNEDYKPTIKTYGQELNEQSYAIAKAEALITGEDANNIKLGNSFSEDHFTDKKFHYIMANPPYGVKWTKDYDFISNESLNPAGRFYAGLPSKSDGQLLFIQHMLSKMEHDGSKIAVVTNASPLFSGDAGSGESEIRKWIISNDWLDCIIALPNDLFYNTGISTYIWILTNKKEEHRKGKVQLINANRADKDSINNDGFCHNERKSLGKKRNKIEPRHIDKILDIYSSYDESNESNDSKVFNNDDFGFYKLTVEQPIIENNVIKKDKKGNPKADTKKRDKEIVPLNEDIQEYFKREVLPHVPNAWIDFDKTRIGYKITFSKYFYEYTAPRDSAIIKKEIVDLDKDISKILKELLD